MQTYAESIQSPEKPRLLDYEPEEGLLVNTILFANVIIGKGVEIPIKTSENSGTILATATGLRISR